AEIRHGGPDGPAEHAEVRRRARRDRQHVDRQRPRLARPADRELDTADVTEPKQPRPAHGSRRHARSPHSTGRDPLTNDTEAIWPIGESRPRCARVARWVRVRPSVRPFGDQSAPAPACLPRIVGGVRDAGRMDTATVSVLLIGVIVGAVLGAGAAWLVLSTRTRASAAEAAKAAADATAMLRADAAGLRAERAGLVQRLDELTETYERTVERLRKAEADAAAAE